MFIKRTILALVVMLILPCITEEALAGEKIVIKFNACYNPKRPEYADLPMVYCSQLVKDYMEARFPDRVQVRVYWDTQLARTYDASINGLQTNLFHISFVPITSLAEFTNAGIPMSNLFLFPYPHTQLVYDAYDGEIGDMIKEKIIKDTRVRPLSFWEVGFRHFMNNKMPIATLDNLKGMKFRVQPNPIHIESFKLLGTNPTPVPYSELFTALQQGVIDGAENPFENILASRLYEVQKYLTLSGHAFEMGILCMGEEFYQSLPDDIRQGLDEVMAQILVEFREGMVTKNQSMLEMFKTKMKVNELPAEELARFRKTVAPMREMSRKIAGEEYADKIYKILAENEAAYFEKLEK